MTIDRINSIQNDSKESAIGLMLSFIIISASFEYSCPLSIKSTYFVNISTSTNGGVICLSVSGCTINIDSCLFLNDSTSQYGGAIYTDYGNITVSRSCFISCNSYHCGFSIYSTSLSSATLAMTSLYKCYSLNSADGACNIQLISSNISLNNINFSFNNAGLHTTTVWNCATSNSSWYYTTIFNNTDSYGATMNSRGAANPYTYAYLNLINNIPHAKYGFLYFSQYATAVKYINCIFTNNTDVQFTYIDTSASSPTFSNCFFDIVSSRVSNCVTSNCSFGLSNMKTISHSYIDIADCQNIMESCEFSSSETSLLRVSIITLFLQFGLSDGRLN